MKFTTATIALLALLPAVHSLDKHRGHNNKKATRHTHGKKHPAKPHHQGGKKKTKKGGKKKMQGTKKPKHPKKKVYYASKAPAGTTFTDSGAKVIYYSDKNGQMVASPHEPKVNPKLLKSGAGTDATFTNVRFQWGEYPITFCEHVNPVTLNCDWSKSTVFYHCGPFQDSPFSVCLKPNKDGPTCHPIDKDTGNCADGTVFAGKFLCNANKQPGGYPITSCPYGETCCNGPLSLFYNPSGSQPDPSGKGDKYVDGISQCVQPNIAKSVLEPTVFNYSDTCGPGNAPARTTTASP